MNTPGPWINKSDHIRGRIVGPDGKSICACASNCSRPAQEVAANMTIIAAAPELLEALKGLNHMGGDERRGYCICPCHDGSAPDDQHATGCVDARRAIARAEGHHRRTR